MPRPRKKNTRSTRPWVQVYVRDKFRPPHEQTLKWVCPRLHLLMEQEPEERGEGGLRCPECTKEDAVRYRRKRDGIEEGRKAEKRDRISAFRERPELGATPEPATAEATADAPDPRRILADLMVDFAGKLEESIINGGE